MRQSISLRCCFCAGVLITCAAVVAQTGPVFAQHAEGEPPQPSQSKHEPATTNWESEVVEVLARGASPVEAKIIRKLYEPVELDFSDAPLADVCDYLSEHVGADVVLYQQALEEVGLDGSTPVTIRCSGMKLKSALRLCLRELDLTYAVDDDALQILTPEAADQQQIIRVYDVSDLVAPTFLDPQAEAALEAGRGRVAVSAGQPAAYASTIDELIDAIYQTIDPVSWDEFGGPGSKQPLVCGNRTVLSIAQTWETHMKIAKWLVQLRQASTPPVSLEKLPLPVDRVRPAFDRFGQPYGTARPSDSGYGFGQGQGGFGSGFGFGGSPGLMPEASQPGQPPHTGFGYGGSAGSMPGGTFGGGVGAPGRQESDDRSSDGAAGDAPSGGSAPALPGGFF